MAKRIEPGSVVWVLRGDQWVRSSVVRTTPDFTDVTCYDGEPARTRRVGPDSFEVVYAKAA